MKILKTIIKYILTIIFTVLLILYILINLASSTVLNENYVLSKLEQTDYYNKIYEYVKSNFENYVYQSGLEENVLNNIITKEKVEKDTKIIIGNIYDGLDEKIQTQEIKDNLNKNIKNEMGDIVLNTTQKKSIDTFVEKICDEYTSTISHFNYEKDINNICSKIVKYIEIGKKVLLIIMGICIILLMWLNIYRIYKFISLLGITLMATGTFFVIVDAFINTKMKVQNIILLNDAITNTLKNILTDILNSIINYGCILVTVGFVLIILSNLIHNIRKYRVKET